MREREGDDYYSAIIRNKILPFAIAWQDLERVMTRGISQIQKDKYHVISLICGIQNSHRHPKTRACR